MQTEKAKSSHFDRTRREKKQIFPTLASAGIDGVQPIWRTMLTLNGHIRGMNSHMIMIY